MAVGENHVEVAIVVIVEKLHTPTTQQPGGGRNAGGISGIGERTIAPVVVKRIGLMVDVGNKQIHPAILIVVCCINPHARSSFTEAAVAHAGERGVLFEMSFPAVQEEEVRRGIVADKQ